MIGRQMTERHEPHSLIVGLDVDDVLLDLMPRWLADYNEEWEDILTPKHITSWDISQHVKPECGKRIYGYLNPDMYADMAPIQGAGQFVQDIRNMGHTPRYITACGDPKKLKLHRAFATAKSDRLKELDIMQDGELLLPGRDKSRAPVDVLIDDRIENVESFRNGLGVLFTQPWNRSSVCTRARSYTDALDLIDRYARHQPCADTSVSCSQ